MIAGACRMQVSRVPSGRLQLANPRPVEVQSAPVPATDENETPLVEAGLQANDPGGAHTKGYSADTAGDPAGTHAGISAGAGQQRRVNPFE